MTTSRFTEAQITGVLRQAEGGMSVPELRRQHRVSRRDVQHVAREVWVTSVKVV